jgi:DNA-binding beta-propeller fold protein YncE
MNRTRALACACVLAVAALVAPAAAAASASSPATTPLSGFSDIVADTVHGRVFVSGGSANDLVVTDTGGQLIATLPDLPGAAGLALSPDSSTLYVALSDGDAVEQIDTATLAETRIDTGDDSCPQHLAITAGMLWYGYGCGSNDGDLGAIDLDTGQVYPALASDSYAGDAPLLASEPVNLPGTLFLGTPGQSPAQLYLYDVTGGSDPSATMRVQREPGDNLRDITVSPDGSEVITAAGSPYIQRVFDTADLSPEAPYRTGAYPLAVAVRPDGMVAAGIDGDYTPDIYIFSSGERARYTTYDFGLSGSNKLQPEGLAFGIVKLFAVTADEDGNNLQLRVIVPKRETTLTIRTDKTTYAYGEGAVVTAHLGDTDSNRVVSIWATAFGGVRRLVKRAQVDAAGNLSATTKVLRKTTFSVTFSGDAHTRPASASVTRQVHARVLNTLRRSYGTSGNYHLYHVHTDPLLTTTVSPNYAGTCVYFRGQELVNGHWRVFATTKCVHLDSLSKAAVELVGTHHVGEHIRMRAEWDTHPANLGSVGAWQYLRFTS